MIGFKRLRASQIVLDRINQRIAPEELIEFAVYVPADYEPTDNEFVELFFDTKEKIKGAINEHPHTGKEKKSLL